MHMVDHGTPVPHGPHRAEVSLRIGRRARLDLRVAIGSDGLLAIGALVSAILLSSAAIVVAAKRPR
ncbi:hypothetical protein [Sphingomonas sp. VNH70]|uniref:hypothetical protein n=1 Tax=Sphingomonas silueang TaxID=3156617 RepID=UPI0032B53CB2